MLSSKSFPIEIIVILGKTEQMVSAHTLNSYQELLNRFWFESRVSLRCINWAINSEGSSVSTGISQRNPCQILRYKYS